ncbi:hypothetical protein [Candidatus Lariskella endosymbiont of Hedychridium roseum]|uniref:hypothetical protein n=1 Tax=Candidatus Lariskella endosymbiont of Hedychridium roseum TaxID=3077949 RepID=UPI0030D409DC
MLKDNETSSIGTFIGDGAYCKMSVHSTAQVITPPTLTFGYHCLGLPAFKDFNESISYMKRHDDKKKA